ncbi:MAG: hypothetical protein JKY95_04535 [Planctomycetaceae bacterium]|nr:hypothetical protein [Planctomycetaceae bacterium]
MKTEADNLSKQFAPNAASLRSPSRIVIATLLTLLASLFLIVPSEWLHWEFTLSSAQPLVAWMAAFNADTSIYLFWLIVLPVVYTWRFHLADPQSPLAVRVESWLQAGKYTRVLERDERKQSPVAYDPRWLKVTVSLIVAVTGLLSAAYVGQQFGDLPPAYHDEYSYLFQVETFSAGHVTNNRFEAAPELFNQMHVLNDFPGKFVSRYFPGTGLWMLPFAALGDPYWGHIFAQGLICLLVFWIGRDLSGNGTGLLAGLLCALAPGMSLFSNLLLAHHPCLVGLMFFLWMFHRWSIRKQLPHAFWAGVGLTFAMYCRPMTAFGIGLPYGIWFWVSVLRSQDFTTFQKTKQLIAMGTPIIIGLVLLLAYNASTTGSALKTPYGQYTQLHTPRHVFGFHNRSRGEKWIADHLAQGNALPIAEQYDRWAKELTIKLAIENEKNRLIASSQWTLGIIPTLAGIVFFCAIGHDDRKQWWGIFAAAFFLHLVHLPYWYVGIMHWHYVFESAPLLILMFARSSQLIAYNARLDNRHWCAVWWISLPLISLMISYTTFEPFWNSRLSAGISEIEFSRAKHAATNHQINRSIKGRAVVFIKKKPEDLHLDFVINSPSLDARILKAHWLPERYSIAQLQELFPDRTLYLLDKSGDRLTKLTP